MASDHLSLTGFSTALFSTWYFCDDMAMLFDCGDGACSGLLQKSRKVKHVFISHADRDHLTGLIQFNQLNARPDLRIYYPEGCGSFPALAKFTARFDPHALGAEWIPLADGAEVSIREDLAVRAIENAHVPAEGGRAKSLSYVVERVARKLKPEFIGKSGSEIAKARQQHGADAISVPQRSPQLIYSGDTPVANDGRYEGCETLIHEATFLTAAEMDPDHIRHSALDQVIPMVASSAVERLILGHFSSRYGGQEIDDAIRQQCSLHSLSIPVYRLLPGMLGRDILASAECRIAN